MNLFVAGLAVACECCTWLGRRMSIYSPRAYLTYLNTHSKEQSVQEHTTHAAYGV